MFPYYMINTQALLRRAPQCSDRIHTYLHPRISAKVRVGYNEPYRVGYEGESTEQLKKCPEALLKPSVSFARSVFLRSRRYF